MTFDIAHVRAALPGRPVVYFESVGSTMTAAAEMREPGTIIVANEQTAGQGRHGHSWHSAPGNGLYFTIVLAPKVAPELLPVVTLALGLAVQEAIAQVCNVQADLRWPNDLLIGSRKIVGILAQLDGDRVLAGIGVNVNHASLPPDLAAIATSLRLVTGREHSREELLCAIAAGVDRMIGLLEEEGSAPVLALFTLQSSYARGRRVQVDLPGKPITGTTAGLTPDGYLLLDGDDGRRHTILAGGVRPEN
ncbi:MAG TPA: biotin--[acetyl-CoA-carboxylase] ligase [Bryobacteraceae bacterium]|nr:biotin--[acetyl-CoA-carboxylase] ligase [Bryobacteraceae bacterium]